MPLGNHLGAHQHIRFTTVCLLQQGFHLPLVAGAVGINAQDIGCGQQTAQGFFNALGTATKTGQVLVAAGGAMRGYLLASTAVVAAQHALVFVPHHVGGAVVAIGHPATGIAHHLRGIATAVQKHNTLLAGFKVLHQRLHGGLAQTLFGREVGRVDQFHLGQAGTQHGPVLQGEALVSPQVRFQPGFKCRGG